MSKIIPVSITTAEQAVTLDATYQFVWLRNMGENDCLLSDHSDIVAGDDNVTLVKAGESGRISTSGRAVYIKAVSGTSTGEIHAQNFSDCPFKVSGKGGGQSITVEPLTVTDNGVYTAPTGKAYSPVTVDVQEQPWQPLEDGYSNFWFELTNDTLSPWLNFSAKNADAVIDWGDGSGEQALTTLTPTHTYAKAGRYVVKVKGVTEIAAQFAQASYIPKYTTVLTNVELNNEVTALNGNAFWRCFGLKNVGGTAVITTMPSGVTSYAAALETFVKLNVTATNTNFYQTFCLKKIVLGSALTTLSNNSFVNCYNLEEIHIEATTPPTFGGVSVLTGLPSNYIIYVPVGTGDTYKSATGWSTYADHILEEGQTPNRMMLAKFNEETDEPQDDMR